jgi:gliding motility-associated transport system permease protein
VSHILAIARRELRSMFVTPDAYVLIGVYMLFAGFVFFASLGTFIVQLQQIQAFGMTQLLEQWNLQDRVVGESFATFALLLCFLVPLLSMRAFAAERANGSIELLLTSPASSGEIVVGKFLAIAAVLLLVSLLTGVFVGLLFVYGDPELWQTLSGLQTLFLYSLALSALCCFISALTKSQIVAGFVGIAAALLLLIIPVAADVSQSDSLKEVLRWVGSSTHFDPGLRGEVRTEDLGYFGIVVLVFLSLARAAVDSLRWR